MLFGKASGYVLTADMRRRMISNTAQSAGKDLRSDKHGIYSKIGRNRA